MNKYEEFAKGIERSLKSQPINTSYLIDTVRQTDYLERLLIRESYFGLFNIELIEDLKALRQLEGKPFECLMIGLFRSPTEYDVYEIYEAVDGAGTDEDVLSEILTTRDTFRINEIRNFYKAIFLTKIEDVMKEEKLSKNYHNFIMKIFNCNEKTQEKEIPAKNQLEKDLYNLNNLKKFNEQVKFDTVSKFLFMRNNEYLRELKAAFEKNSNKKINETLTVQFQNPIRDLIIYSFNSQCDPIAFYAQRIYNAFKSEKKNNKRIVRTLISVYPTSMTAFKNFIQSEYRISLDELIKINMKGLFKELLLVITNCDNRMSEIEITSLD